MADRRGEKIGWVGGWLGGFCWLAGFGIWSFLEGDFYGGVSSLALYGSAGYLTWRAAPWNHPETPYWKLMTPLYGLFLVAVYLTLRTIGGLEAAGLHWYSFFWLGPVLLPLFVVGSRRWEDGKPEASG